MPEHTTQTAAGKLGTLWCDLMHDSPMWPIHGQYQCRTCGRRYPVAWSGERLAAEIRPARAASLRSVSLPLVLLLAALLLSTARAADLPDAESNAAAAAGMAFARYTAGVEQGSAWDLETVDIAASLPKLDKKGKLHAIRRLLPFGKPEYQVLELAGDQTVRQQVIIRYLTGEVRAAAIPRSEVAITPANYKFRYKGPVKRGETVAYVFQITPHQKRDGLIKGELWLDGDGAAVRQSGRLVKRPSIFVKRVDVTRETVVKDGLAAVRITHLAVDVRLVGRAELTIEERPYTVPENVVALSPAERPEER
jgi:hypothetical protein